jgi:hypothetical protein
MERQRTRFQSDSATFRDPERLNHKLIGTEHLPLGLLREEKRFRREIMLRAAEEYFKITVIHEIRACEKHVAGATDQTPPEYANSGNLGFH